MSDPSEDLWRTFHDSHAHEYMSQWYVQHWKEEVDFIVDELDLKSGDRVLDVGCGAGRHSVELARRGCQVTGIDISTGMLDEARKAAAAIDVEVDWRHCDATQFSPDWMWGAGRDGIRSNWPDMNTTVRSACSRRHSRS